MARVVKMGDAVFRNKFNLAVGMIKKGQLDNALSILHDITKMNSNHDNISIVYNEIGAIYVKKKLYEDSFRYFSIALEKHKDYEDALNNIGALYALQNEYDKSKEYFVKTIVINPVNKLALENMAHILQFEGNDAEALQYLLMLHNADMNNIDVMSQIGSIYLKQDYLKSAIEWYEKLLNIAPNFFNALIIVGDIYSKIGQTKLALEYFFRASKALPDSYDPYNRIGSVYQHIGKIDDAIKYYHIALTKSHYTEDDKFMVYSNILLALNYSVQLSDQELFNRHLEYGELFLKGNHVKKDFICDIGKKIRVGYVSGDFRCHSVSHFILGPIAMHDKLRFDIFCYSDVKNQDGVTNQLKDNVSIWRDIYSLSNNEVEKIILKDKIDILVDLAGHTGKNRLPLFARRVAPVQVTWIGYPNTTGLACMDFRLTDEYSDPVGNDKLYTEKLIRLPDTFLCYTPSIESPDIKNGAPQEPGQVTFGSFNNFAKITDEMLNIWAEILKKLPLSSLLIKAKVFADEATVKETFERFLALGVNPLQINLIPWTNSTSDHLETYNKVDIALDTFPYNGTTTTCESLYMGVPVITLVGKRHASRVGLSLLTNVGLKELIANSALDYINKAVELADDIPRLEYYKNNLRDIMKGSVLMNSHQFTNNLEEAYQKMVADYFDNKRLSLDEINKSINYVIHEIDYLIKSKDNNYTIDNKAKIDSVFSLLIKIISSGLYIDSLKDHFNSVIVNINKSLELITKAYSCSDIDSIKKLLSSVLLPICLIISKLVYGARDITSTFGDRRLHIGGTVRKDGWEVFNALDAHYVDHLGNANDLSRFEENTFMEIYASHVLEHFDYKDELLEVLKEWRRVLKPEGKLYISVPDIGVLTKVLNDESNNIDESIHIMRMIFGGHVSDYDYHKVGFNFNIIKYFLKAAGYKNIERVNSFGYFEDSSILKYKGENISLNVTAVKEK